MLTRNYKLAINKSLGTSSNFSGLYDMRSGELIYNTYFYPDSWDRYVLDPLSGYRGLYLIAGTGDTAPSDTDYCLENPVNLTPISGVVSTINEQVVKSVTATFENTGDTPVTIKEIGLVMHGSASISSSADQVDALLGRIVLDTPLTIQPHAVRSVTYVAE